jgi:hypothetical protein
MKIFSLYFFSCEENIFTMILSSCPQRKSLPAQLVIVLILEGGCHGWRCCKHNKKWTPLLTLRRPRRRVFDESQKMTAKVASAEDEDDEDDQPTKKRAAPT